MPAQDILRGILTRAVYAPSGDNAQPWEFALHGDVLYIFNKPDADETLYNFHQRGSYLAHGALTENIVLLSSQIGLCTKIEPFPGDVNCTVKISFTPTLVAEEPLCEAIKIRATNRKPYAQRPLESQHRKTLFDVVQSFPDVTLHLVEERIALQDCAHSLSLNERLLMENRPLHDFLFSMIRWTPKDEEKQPGLYIKTMELPPPVRLLFKYVLPHWSIVQLLTTVGFSRLISAQTAGLYQSSAAIGFITTTSQHNEDFFTAGRAFQRMWLSATNNQLSLQPVTALPYLMQRIEENEATMFTSAHIARIQEANTRLRTLAGLREDEHIAMIFRVGYGPTPSAYSMKIEPRMRAKNY